MLVPITKTADHADYADRLHGAKARGAFIREISVASVGLPSHPWDLLVYGYVNVFVLRSFLGRARATIHDALRQFVRDFHHITGA